MEIVRAYRTFADRLFGWAVENFSREIDSGFPVLRVVSEPEVEYTLGLSILDRRVLYRAICRMSIYATRVRGAVPYSIWANVNGTQQELEAYYTWRQAMNAMPRDHGRQSTGSVPNRELRAQLLPCVRSAIGVKAECSGGNCSFVARFNGWMIITEFSCSNGVAHIEGRVIRNDITEVGRDAVSRQLTFGPWMPIVFPGHSTGLTFYSSPTKLGDFVEAVKLVLPLQWSSMETLTRGLGPDDPDELSDSVSQAVAAGVDRSSNLEAKGRPKFTASSGPRNEPLVASAVAADAARYDLIFLRGHDETQVEDWVSVCAIRAIVLGASSGWTSLVVDAPHGVVPTKMVESNPGYLVSTRLDSDTGWSFEIFDHSSKVCAFSLDWRSGFAHINSDQVDLDVIDRLSGLAQLDYSFKDMFTAIDPVIPLQLKTLADLLTNQYAWTSYADDITPDMLFAEVLHLPDAVGTDDFDGLTFDRLFREYMHDPDMFRESFPNAKLISPSSP